MAARKPPKNSTRAFAEREAKRLLAQKWQAAGEEPQAKRATSAARRIAAIQLRDDENTALASEGLSAHEYRSTPVSGPQFKRFLIEELGYDLVSPQPHDELCEFVIEMVPNPRFDEDGRRYCLILVPRDCFKSTIIAIGLPLYLWVKNQNACGLLSGFRHDIAQLRLKEIKRHIERPKFIAKFGNWKPQFREDMWNEDAIMLASRGTSSFSAIDPSLDTCGVDRPKTGSHPDYIIIDDAHNRENTQTPKMRLKVYQHITDMLPMLKPGGTMFIVGTRWHHQDAYGKIIREDEQKVRKAAEAGDPDPNKAATYRKLIRGAKDAAGNLYFPSRLTEKYLDDMRHAPGITEYFFLSQYFNKTVESAQTLFPDIENYIFEMQFFLDPYSRRNGLVRVADEPETPIAVSLAWDTAGHSPTAESDFHGLTVVGCDIDWNWYVLVGEAIKDTPDKVVDRVCVHIIMYQPHTVSIEVVAQSGVWITLLRKRLDELGIYMPYIFEAKPPQRMSKLDRIDTVLQPRWKSGRMGVADTCVDLIAQMEEYPQVDHFDVMDSLAQHEGVVRPAESRTESDLLIDREYLDLIGQGNGDPRRRMGAFAGRASLPRRKMLA